MLVIYQATHLRYERSGARSCFIDGERLPLEFRRVQAFDGGFRLQQNRHFEECESRRSFIEPSPYDVDKRYFTECFERLPKVVFSHLLRQITGINIHEPFLSKVSVGDNMKP